jgi:hypothetical protein
MLSYTLVKHISFLIKDVTVWTLRVMQRNPAELQQKNVVSKQTRWNHHAAVKQYCQKERS